MKHHHKAKFNSAGTEPFTEPPPTPAPKPHTRFHGIDWILWFVLIPGLILFFTAEIWGFCAMTSCVWNRVHHAPASAPPSYAEEIASVNGRLGYLESYVATKELQTSTLELVTGIARDIRPFEDRQVYQQIKASDLQIFTNQITTNIQVQWRTQYLHLPPVYLWKTNTVEHTNWQWHAVQMRR